jgi:hypothetical protein
MALSCGDTPALLPTANPRAICGLVCWAEEILT